MPDDYSTESLQAEERECLSRVRQRAAELRAANPSLSAKYAFTKAFETLPKTLNKYMWIQGMLQSRGIPMQPLR
jgi:hypothetical protein